ncbi:MAG: hypothetical protein IKJ45_15295 [Kiritimatiellae bacterium]|nr:hypothetical protein [Kiritimatiellia bacterium]
MKITLELPDCTVAAFVGCVVDEGDQMVLVNKAIGTNDLKAGYKDCTEYEVSE